MADALEAAHEKVITHRASLPANGRLVKLRDGADVLHLRFLGLFSVWSKRWDARQSRTSAKT
jgi:hypothetical protein